MLIHLQKVEKEMEVVDIWCELKYRTKLLYDKTNHTNMTVFLHTCRLKIEMFGVGGSLRWGGRLKP